MNLLWRSITTGLGLWFRQLVHFVLALLLVTALALALMVGTNSGRSWLGSQGIWLANQFSDWYIQATDIRSASLGEWTFGTLRVYPPALDESVFSAGELNIRFPLDQWNGDFRLHRLAADEIMLDIERLSALGEEQDAGAPAALPPTPEQLLGRGARIDDISIERLEIAHSGQPGDSLAGRAEGNLAWGARNRFPELQLNWRSPEHELDLLKLTTESRTTNGNDSWSVTADSTIPPNSWLQGAARWPLDEPLSASLQTTLNVSPLQLEVSELSVPWLGYRVALSGRVRQLPGGWALQDAELGVDDRMSRLQGRWIGGAGSVAGTLDLPLAIFEPWLPEGLTAHGLTAQDRLTADVDWSSDAPWAMSADLQTQWYRQGTSINLSAGGNRFAVNDIEADARIGESMLSATGAWHLRTHSGALQLSGDLDNGLLEPLPQLAIVTDWIDRVQLNGTLIGNGRNEPDNAGGQQGDGSIAWPDWQGTMAASGRIPEGYGIPAGRDWEATARTEWQHPQLDWRELELSVGPAASAVRLGSAGDYQFDGGQINARWTLQPADLLPWLRDLNAAPADLSRARVAASGQIEGPINRPDLSTWIRSEGVFLGETWQLEFESPQLSLDRVLVDRLHTTWRDSSLTASGSLQPDLNADWREWQTQLDVSPVSLSLANLASVVPEWPQALDEGNLMSSISVRGALGDPELLAQARLNASYRDEALTGSVNWQADNLQADFNWQDRYIRLDGAGRPWNGGDWQLRFERLRTADIQPWVDIPEPVLAAGLTHSGTLQVQGNINDAEATLESTHSGRWQGRDIEARLNGTASVLGRELEAWSLADSRINWGDATATLAVASNAGDPLPDTGTLAVNRVPLQEFVSQPGLVADLSGQVAFTAAWPDWEVSPDLALNGEFNNEPLEAALAADLAGTDQRVRMVDVRTLALDLGNLARIRGNGGLQDQQWDLALDWDGLNWQPPASWPVPNAQWSGDGRLRLRGEGDNPDIRGTMNWQSEWPDRSDGEPIPMELNMQAGTTDSRLALTAALESPGEELALAGLELPRQPWTERLGQPWREWPFEGYWEIDIPMALLGFWLGQESLQLQGDLTGDGVASGPLADPDFEAAADWSEGAMRIASTNTELYDIAASLSSDSADRVDITANARAGDGTLSLSGALAREGGQWSSDLALSLDNAAILQRPDIQSLANGELGLTGPLSNMQLAGTVGLRELSVNLNRLSDNSIPQLQVSNDAQLGNGRASIPVTLDVTLNTDGSASIRGNGLDAMLSGELRVNGTPDDLSSDGALTIDSGSFNLLTRRFDLREGELRLVDEALNIDILAVHQRGDTTIEARLTGNTEELRLQLQSTPSLPEDEIIAQLLFGKTVQNMTPWQALQLANAVNQLRGGESIDLLLATRNTLGLDTLEVESGEEGENATLRVGRYLNSRVYLEVDTELAAEQDWQSTVEVELTPNLNLETFTGSGGRGGGLQLRWRRDY